MLLAGTNVRVGLIIASELSKELLKMTECSPLIFGIHCDRHGWHSQYKAICDKYGFPGVMVDLFSDDWVTAVSACDVVLFKGTMYPDSIRILKERVYFLESVLGKKVVPNYNAYWHFDSKAIQRDIFQAYGLNIPHSVVAGTCDDVRTIGAFFPHKVVMKETSGAGSSQVRLVSNNSLMRWSLRQWQLNSILYRCVSIVLRTIGLRPCKGPQKIIQEMVENDGFDIRVTTIGSRYAYVFKRYCRDRDFRASGSGKLDYSWDDKYVELIYSLMAFSRSMGFNTMAYDIIVDRNGRWYLIEMSASFDDKALADCPNVFRVSDDLRGLERIGKVSPLELQIMMFADCSSQSVNQ